MKFDISKRLQPVGMSGVHYNVADVPKFELAVRLLKESLFDGGATLFSADNLITWNRNLSFLREERLTNNFNDPAVLSYQKSQVWRTYILLYFAKIASGVNGDFLELGCHSGFTAGEVVKSIDFVRLGKKYYLYDFFKWEPGDEHTHLPNHDDPMMYENVAAKFADYPFVKIVKGSVPDSFSQGLPDEICFAHIDMNHPDPEAGALEVILPRLQKGGVVVFDDYGWWGYSAQKMALDPIVHSSGLEILELPTGQGLLIKT